MMYNWEMFLTWKGVTSLWRGCLSTCWYWALLAELFLSHSVPFLFFSPAFILPWSNSELSWNNMLSNVWVCWMASSFCLFFPPSFFGCCPISPFFPCDIGSGSSPCAKAKVARGQALPPDLLESVYDPLLKPDPWNLPLFSSLSGRQENKSSSDLSSTEEGARQSDKFQIVGSAVHKG